MAPTIVLLTIMMFGVHMPAGYATDLPGSTLAAEALAVCHQASHDSPALRSEQLARGLALAESAVAQDPSDARAHFAVFCNLGRQVQNEGLSFWRLGTVRRLRREIDRVLELEPDAIPALIAKTSFLLELPRLFGGDLALAEETARHAVDTTPSSAIAHVTLAKVLVARGAHDEARAELQRVLPTAVTEPEDGLAVEEARMLLSRPAGS